MEQPLQRGLLLLILVFSINVLSGCNSLESVQEFKNDMANGRAQYRLTLMAYNSGTQVSDGRSMAGHASVSIDRDGVWGFYPSSPGRLLTVHGELRHSSEYPITQEYVEFIIDESTKEEIYNFIFEWAADPPCFFIPFNDCVSFMYHVCDIAGIKYNPLALLPIDAIRTIRIINSGESVL